jgi:proton-coupled amino acid transporter
MFAFSFAYIELELQDTVHGDGTPRGPVRPMKRACNVAVTIITAFYLAVGVAGYGVFGDGADNQFGVAIQDDILASFPAGAATWVVVVANALVLVHLVPAYAVWSQPFFAFFEQWADRAEARTGRRPCGVSALAFRVSFRTLFVVLGTLLACAIPSLGIILGLAGALAFWPATVLFPIVCWIAVFKPRPAVRWALQGLNLACFVVTAMTAVSGVQQIVVQASSFKIFKE